MGETLSWCQKLEQFMMDNMRLTPEIHIVLFWAEGGLYNFQMNIEFNIGMDWFYGYEGSSSLSCREFYANEITWSVWSPHGWRGSQASSGGSR